MIISFNNYLKEQRISDYTESTKKITRDDFFEIYKKNCYDYDIKNPFLLRQIKSVHPYLYIDTPKHESMNSDINHIFLAKIVDNWKNFPKKSKSLNFYSKNFPYFHNILNGMGHYGNDYYLIPFNGSKFGISKNLFGHNFSYVTRFLLPKNHYASITTILSNIISFYKNKTEKNPINEDDLLEMIDFFDNINIDEIGNDNDCKTYDSLSNNIIINIKKLSADLNKNFFDTLEFCFDPIKNNFVSATLEDLKNIKTDYVGWTDSNALMMSKNVFHHELLS